MTELLVIIVVLASSVSTVMADPTPIPKIECEDRVITLVFNNKELNPDLTKVHCLTSVPEPTPIGNVPTPMPTALPPTTDRPCIGIALDKLTGDNGWLGFAGVELAEKKKITYCATLTRQASYISFKAYDITDRKCGSADIRVRQVGNTGWSKNSGFASSPIVNAAGTRWSGNPAWTAAGVYEVILELGPGSPGCTRFDIAWRATGSGGI